MLSLLLEPKSQVRRISDALHQQAFTDPVAAEVLPLISFILITSFRNKTITEICAMGGLTLEDFTQSRACQEIFGSGEARGEEREAAKVALRQLNRRCGPLSEATTARIQALPLEQLEAYGISTKPQRDQPDILCKNSIILFFVHSSAFDDGLARCKLHIQLLRRHVPQGHYS